MSTSKPDDTWLWQEGIESCLEGFSLKEERRKVEAKASWVVIEVRELVGLGKWQQRNRTGAGVTEFMKDKMEDGGEEKEAKLKGQF